MTDDMLTRKELYKLLGYKEYEESDKKISGNIKAV